MLKIEVTAMTQRSDHKAYRPTEPQYFVPYRKNKLQTLQHQLANIRISRKIRRPESDNRHSFDGNAQVATSPSKLLEPYKHIPLDPTRQQIRLLRILSRNGKDNAIHCELQAFDLDDPAFPVYQALSYVWGPPTDVKTIYIDSHPFEIRTNLWDFLDIASGGIQCFSNGVARRALDLGRPPFTYKKETVLRHRLDWSATYVYVDQVCIDQGSHLEKAHQVQLMSQIYRRAETVLCWLGRGDDLSHTSMGYLQAGLLRPLLIRERPVPEKLAWNAYFSRLWILQEVLLARRPILACGSIGLDLDDVITGMEGLTYHWPADTLFKYRKEFDMRFDHLEQHGRPHMSLPRLLFDFHSFKCEMVQDRIYAMLGLVSPGAAKEIDVNYDWTLSDVFWQAFHTMLPDLTSATYWETIVKLSRQCGVRSCEWAVKAHLSYSKDDEALLLRGLNASMRDELWFETPLEIRELVFCIWKYRDKLDLEESGTYNAEFTEYDIGLRRAAITNSHPEAVFVRPHPKNAKRGTRPQHRTGIALLLDHMRSASIGYVCEPFDKSIWCEVVLISTGNGGGAFEHGIFIQKTLLQSIKVMLTSISPVAFRRRPKNYHLGADCYTVPERHPEFPTGKTVKECFWIEYHS